MANLLPRFYDVTAGRLLIDGIDVRDVTFASLRQQIGLVPQETMLFNASVRENILYGRLDATEDEIVAAAKAANAHEFIMRLPGGYDALVGDGATPCPAVSASALLLPGLFSKIPAFSSSMKRRPPSMRKVKKLSELPWIDLWKAGLPSSLLIV